MIFGAMPGTETTGGRTTPAAPIAADWFARVRPHCNPVEVDTVLKRDPPGAGVRDQADASACLAIAGKIPQAKAVLASVVADLAKDAQKSGPDDEKKKKKKKK